MDFVFAGLVPEQKGQMAQTREDGSCPTGLERLRALDDGRFAESDAGLEPRTARRSVVISATAVRTARFPVAPADGLSELPNAARRAQSVFRAKIATVAAATATAPDDRHTAVVVLDVHFVVVHGVRQRS